MLHAYCIRRSTDPLPPSGTTGVDGRPIRALREGRLGIWVSEGAAAGVPTAARIRDHDAVVRLALRSASPLPMRFGTSFQNERAVRQALSDRADEFAASLDRVSGRVEMGLRVLWEEAAVRREIERTAPASDRLVAMTPGRAYLEARRREIDVDEDMRDRARDLLDRVEADFHDLQDSRVRELLPGLDVAGTLAHLVEKTKLVLYRERAERARRALPEGSVILSGPFAPYSFV